MIEIPPIRITTSEFDDIEAKIKALFKKEIYLPLMREFDLNGKALKNAKADLMEAIRSGRITFNRGKFSGKLNATLSQELRALGATWDRTQKCYSIHAAELPLGVRAVISASSSYFADKIAAIDQKLAAILPKELAEKLQISKIFDRTIWKVDSEFQKSVKRITVTPKLSDSARERIADEWQNNMQLWVKDFTEKEIQSLRAQMQKSVLAGNRYGSAVRAIQESYGVTERKAKFLARQETSLLVTKLKEIRYQDAGINEYKWRCVAGTPKHLVRPRHRALNDASLGGKIFRFDDPPVTSEPGEPERRNNPGADFNCRCTSVPVVNAKRRTA